MSKRKTVRPEVREISRVSIYGEVYGGKDLRKSFLGHICEEVLSTTPKMITSQC